MATYTRKQIQDFYIRTCRDSGFKMSFSEAAHFAGKLLQLTALEIAATFPSIDVMKEIAAGTHKICNSSKQGN